MAPYQIYVAESRLTFEGTAWEDEEIAYSDWGRTAESEDRLTVIIEEYFRVEEERSQPHPRKTIVFAVSERQAVILERLFNKLLPDAACRRIAEQAGRYPAEVRQSFAQKITCYSNNSNPKPIIDRFKFDPLPVIAVSKAFDQPTGSLNDFIRAALGLYQFPTREQRLERAFTVWVAEHSNSINPQQARMLRLLHNVVLASIRETKYTAIDASVFTRAPFTLLGGRDHLAAILTELNQLIAAA
ncbi:MAG: type I restriction-modification enzyme R subunit C-terminal domain-containing protein [Terrimicrobiaceae bacterium]